VPLAPIPNPRLGLRFRRNTGAVLLTGIVAHYLSNSTRVGLALWVLAVVIMTFPGGPAWSQEFLPPPGKPVIIEFSRPLCPLCKEMEAILLKIKARYRDRLEVHFAYRETDEQLFKKYRIVIVPTQVFLDAAGREVHRHEGLFPQEDLLRKLRELELVPE
jgi:thioredoxin 1